jgi:hypothetical protein
MKWPAVCDKRSWAREDSETPVGGEVFFQVVLRVAKGHPVLLQQPVDLESCLQPEEAPDLRLRQGTRPIALHGNGLQGVARHVSPVLLKGFGDVFRQADGDFHGMGLRNQPHSNVKGRGGEREEVVSGREVYGLGGRDLSGGGGRRSLVVTTPFRRPRGPRDVFGGAPRPWNRHHLMEHTAPARTQRLVAWPDLLGIRQGRIVTADVHVH